VGTYRCQALVALDPREVPEHFDAFHASLVWGLRTPKIEQQNTTTVAMGVRDDQPLVKQENIAVLA